LEDFLSLFSSNKRYQRLRFKTEAELEALISSNSKLLFGDRSVYIDVKKRINSGELGKTIPDALLFDLSDVDNPKFFLVEVELAKHSFFNHIFPQITKFFAFIREGNSYQSDLISFLYKFIQNDPKLSLDFKSYLGSQELFKFLKDTVENTTEILILIDELKPEFKEIKETYTDTWDKYVQILTVNKYYNEKNDIIQIEPDFEVIKDELPSVEEIAEEESVPRRYTEEYHLEGVRPDIKKLYYSIRDEFSDFQLNPQKHYISIRSGHNFVFIKMRKSKIKLTVMLPFEQVQKAAKKLTIVEPALSVQRFYYGKCSSFLLNDESELPEALNIIKAASNAERIKVPRE
jgi:predicted transport protein